MKDLALFFITVSCVTTCCGVASIDMKLKRIGEQICIQEQIDTIYAEPSDSLTVVVPMEQCNF